MSRNCERTHQHISKIAKFVPDKMKNICFHITLLLDAHVIIYYEVWRASMSHNSDVPCMRMFKMKMMFLLVCVNEHTQRYCHACECECDALALTGMENPR